MFIRKGVKFEIEKFFNYKYLNFITLRITLTGVEGIRWKANDLDLFILSKVS